MFSPDKWLANPSTGFYGHTIDQSLRFEDGDSAYLSRTPGSASNQKTWTWSSWIKRGNLGSIQTIFSGGTGSTLSVEIRFGSSDKIEVLDTNSSYLFITSAVFRDVSSFYNIVLVNDTTQSTVNDRTKLFVNGTQITSFSTDNRSNFAEDEPTGINSDNAHYIGRWINGGQLFDGYMAEINFLDGIANDPTTLGLGETKDGIWIPKAYSGSYGTNGFHLDFADSSAIGNDVSGQNNDYTVSGLVASDVVPDSPTNNFATFNYLPYSTNFRNNLGNGNLYSNPGGNCMGFGTIALTTGKKWYMEGKAANNYNTTMGIFELNDANTIQNSLNTAYYNNTSYKSAFYHRDGTKYIDGSNSSYGAAFVIGDIIGMAVDLESGTNTITFYKNNASQGSFNLGANGLDYLFCMARGTSGGGWYMNFGQDSSFANTKTTGSAGASDANGIGDFYYAPPSGFLALCSANLPEAAIIDGSEYFNTVLYTGNNSVQAITGVGFQPDFTWIKNRDQNDGNALTDSVRGVTKELLANSSNSEITNADGLTAFGTDGFTVGDDVIYNTNSENYVSWNWKAGGTASTIAVDSISSGVPSIASSVSANTTAGFSIVSFTTDGVTSGTVGHGLGVQPQLIIGATRNHSVPWYAQTPLTATNIVGIFSQADAFYNPGYNHWNDTHPTADVFSVGGYMADHADLTNPSTKIVYCFANVDGYSKVGSYTGNGADDGAFVYTGFRPAWLMVKRTSAIDNWVIDDAVRSPINEMNNTLYANLNNEEYTAGLYGIDFLSNGFKIRDNDGNYNGSGSTYIYLAFAQSPFKFANAR